MMDNNQFKTLEEKAKGIVSTLESLERETKEYQNKNLDIVFAINNLAKVSTQVEILVRELSSATTLFSSSDFSKAIKEIDKRIDKINEAEVVLTDQAKAIDNILKSVLTEYNKLSTEIKDVNRNILEMLEIKNTVNDTKVLLELLITKIDRIDRNTQKGFGKERG